MLPKKQGVYLVKGSPGTDFEDRTFAVYVDMHRPADPFWTYEFYPSFFGEFKLSDFEVIECVG